MKTDKFWMSALWGRIGAALVLIVGTFLQSRGVEVTQEQMDGANSLIDSLIAHIHIVLAAAMVIISKLREVKKAQPPAAPSAGRSGSIGVPIVMGIALACVVAISILTTMDGCAANRSATQQIRTQTNDPAVIALGTFADAQDAYIVAAELYQPYQAALRASNPALDQEILGYLRSADKILAKWEADGDVPPGDKQAFRDDLRKISIRTAQLIEEGGEHGQDR